MFWSLACLGRACAVPDPGPWVVGSPDRGQTFAYGTERHRQWLITGPDNHLTLSIEFTNDPYVNNIMPRRYDYFIFNFPSVKLGADGRTLYYHPPGDRSVPVASRHRGPFGLAEVNLLPNSLLLIKSPHGYLSLDLVVTRHPSPDNDEG